ncbi:MAG: Rrf2 family transcriptional regulator [Flavobacteriales bacterium]|jgi:Rrf2 family iron-sulfur cluster assembly transcriptional regulator|nr:Rrf2 family transcriptional regulator [Flavobacteriales bacterium]MBK6549216.1 Rrf2 family transcriptional regulator [Flavobacteriales bacterium]MBK6884205.1 Rrf2 family transcriptional regulator [Flavobacteriales bacterium]MBK7100585.1 Rrf2 family transcriptional regulator [Flavobacteriales bacterium]MBK7111281.1 Rrf2 family transcriptional regulator [Flavobacteriales bacterium]
MFSKTCQYAFRTTTVIAVASAMGERLSLDAIAERTDSPKAFTAKVLQQLTRAGIMESHKGPSGGFDLPPLMAKKIKLSHIVKAIDDDTVYRGCGMGLKACNASKPCPLHDHFEKIREDLRNMLENTTIHCLTAGLEQGSTYLKR